jgi:myo-inositol 2-dehydrogenase/D-chiro-inositol 1-dehydrogenase
MRRTTRRDFLKNSAAAGAVISAPMIWTRSSARGEDANSKKTVASIGVGGSRGRYSQGGYIAGEAAKLGQMIAVCDVDQLHNEEFNMEQGGQLNMYTDYRELFDVEKPDIVTIGTPDHWHVPIAIRALRAGCDVYCEKPLTLTIQEGIELRNVVEETGQIFQVGTQQRSENELRFLKAVAIVQSGRLGSNVNAYVSLGGGPPDGPFDSAEVPDGLDWDMWVGPAPWAEYSEQRRRMFRWWHEYSGGKITDWGAHHVDIAQWALGFGDSGPVKVSGTGNFPPQIPDNFNWNAFFDGEATLPSGYNTATEFVVNLEFDNGSVLSVHNHYQRDDGTEFENGILFEGESGRIFVNRGKFTGKPLDDLTEADNLDIEERMVELYKGKQPGSHMKNFFECIEERVQPVSDVATHHRTMTSCHMCNIALWLGRDLQWDPEAEHFISDDQANALMTRKSRDGIV